MSRRKYKQSAMPNATNAPPPVDAVRVSVPPDGTPKISSAAPDEARLALGQRVAELEAAEQQNAAIQAEMLRQAQSADLIDHLFPHASPASKTWLRQHREALDQVKLLRLQGAHAYALADGLRPTPTHILSAWSKRSRIGRPHIHTLRRTEVIPCPSIPHRRPLRPASRLARRFPEAAARAVAQPSQGAWCSAPNSAKRQDSPAFPRSITPGN